MGVAAYLSWHIVFEFMSILISFCVFFLSHYAYKQNRTLSGILLANIFLIMGIIDIFHTLSFKGMPYFLIDNNTANRATTFWIIARLIGAIGISSVSFISPNKRSRIDRRIFAGFSVTISFIILIVATYFPQLLPTMYIEGTGVTQIKKILEYIIIVFLFVAGIMFFKQYVERKNNSSLVAMIAITTSIFGELAFVSYYSVYDIYNYLGHVYKFISYVMVFMIAFIYYIEKPYAELLAAKNKLKENAGNLNKLVAERTKELDRMNKKLLKDLEYARDIQKAMLPDKLPNNDKVTFEAKYYPAEKVSGDFYNIFSLDEKRIGMYISDVCGHGVRAAMLTVFLNQSIKTIKESEGMFEIISPSKVLENLYELYNKVNFEDDQYILVLYAIYNIETKTLVYSSAGMNVQPLILKGNQISEMDIEGLPICKLMDICPADYTDKTIQLDDGDKVLFYTDGLVELNNKQTGESFTKDQLKRLITEFEGRSCLELYEQIDKNIERVTDGGELRDDITFFMLQVN